MFCVCAVVLGNSVVDIESVGGSPIQSEVYSDRFGHLSFSVVTISYQVFAW